MLVISSNEKISSWHKFLDDIDARKSFKNYEYATSSNPETQRWYRVSGSPYYGRYGEYLGFRGAGIEITSDKKVRLEQDKVAQRMNEIADLVFGIIWETDKNLNINFISDNNIELLGIDRSALIGKNLKDLFVTGDDESSIGECLVGRKPFVGKKLEQLGVSGQYDEDSNYEINGKPYYDFTHDFLGFRGTCKRIVKNY